MNSGWITDENPTYTYRNSISLAQEEIQNTSLTAPTPSFQLQFQFIQPRAVTTSIFQGTAALPG